MIKYDFRDKKVLITGAASGIGSEIAKMFASAGANVFISGSNEEKLQNFFQELKQGAPTEANIRYGACNLSNADEAEALVPKASEALGGLDVLVCNAGITNDKLMIRMTNEDFTKVLQVNLVANFILNREAAKIMSKSRYGRIINVASVVGIIGNPGQANYAASKAGLIGMTKALSSEVAKRNITVNAIAPGFTETNMVRGLSPELREEMTKQIPMGRYAEVKDIANAVLFLASEEASYITGTTINISGGMVRS